MAPHDTNTPKEVRARRHIGPLIGLLVIFAFVAIAFLWWIGSEPETTETSRPVPVEEQLIEPVE